MRADNYTTMKNTTDSTLAAVARIRALRLVLWARDLVAFCCKFHLQLYRASHSRKFGYWWYDTEDGESYFGIRWKGWILENVGYLPSQNVEVSQGVRNERS